MWSGGSCSFATWPTWTKTVSSTWLDRYERLWRTAGTDQLASLFTADAQYLESPVEEPRVGLAAIAAMWDEAA